MDQSDPGPHLIWTLELEFDAVDWTSGPGRKVITGLWPDLTKALIGPRGKY